MPWVLYLLAPQDKRHSLIVFLNAVSMFSINSLTRSNTGDKLQTFNQILLQARRSKEGILSYQYLI